MNDCKRILMIGGTNLGSTPLGGEEYKNQLIYSYLKKRFNITLVDTHKWRRKPMVLASLLKALLIDNYDKIIISVTTLSAYRLIYFLAIFPNILSKTIYFVIGGNIASFLKYKTNYTYKYTKLSNILVEGRYIVNDLHSLGISENVTYIPNFKPIKKRYIKSSSTINERFKFVFVSSIIEEKGVNLILDASRELSSNIAYKDKFSVDFWGPFESQKYKLFFEKKLENLSENCSYRGYLNIKEAPSDAYLILSNYDCFLFPTVYPGEGFPGVFIDASISGLPVIASNWNMNSEIIIDGKNGIIVEPNSIENLTMAMAYMIDNPGKVDSMRAYANKLALQYDMESLLDKELIPIINQ